jgi:hypothetical protein
VDEPITVANVQNGSTSGEASRRLDSQTLEIVGRHRLAGELLMSGLEVAFPARDRGVDLIAYADVDPGAGRFVARPIQLKAASRRSFGVWKKYERIHDLVFAFVWHLDGADPPETYALTHGEALAVGEAMGWLATESWTLRGAYNTNNPGARLRGLLEPFRMNSEKWREKITKSQ